MREVAVDEASAIFFCAASLCAFSRSLAAKMIIVTTNLVSTSIETQQHKHHAKCQVALVIETEARDEGGVSGGKAVTVEREERPPSEVPRRALNTISSGLGTSNVKEPWSWASTADGLSLSKRRRDFASEVAL